MYCLVSQGTDRWEWDPEVPAARDPGWPAASSSPHPHSKVPGQCWHHHLVPHLHVGGHISQVPTLLNILHLIFTLLTCFISGNQNGSVTLSWYIYISMVEFACLFSNEIYISVFSQECGASNLVRHGRETIWNSTGLKNKESVSILLSCEKRCL